MHPIKAFKARVIYPWIEKHYEKTRDGKKIKKYQNKYKGQRCFIVANGPSLRAEDLDKLHQRDEITFGMNRIYKLFDKTSWRPTFYVCEDELIIKEKQTEINAIPAQEKFIPIELNWWHNINIDNALYFHLNYDKEKQSKYGFSSEIAHQIDCRATVTASCMQIAAYMGFSEIYLLGVDHNYQKTIDINGNVVVDPNAKDYFCEDYNKDRDKLFVPTPERSELAYMAAQAFAEHSDVKIYNATRGGKLEVFPRVNFDDIEF